MRQRRSRDGGKKGGWTKVKKGCLLELFMYLNYSEIFFQNYWIYGSFHSAMEYHQKSFLRPELQCNSRVLIQFLRYSRFDSQLRYTVGYFPLVRWKNLECWTVGPPPMSAFGFTLMVDEKLPWDGTSYPRIRRITSHFFHSIISG